MKTLEPRKEKGLIIVITGNGKGKTTAALGMALRAAGHGMKSCIIHFLKGDLFSGEFTAVKMLLPHIESHVCGKGYVRGGLEEDSMQEHREGVQTGMRLAWDRVENGSCNILILDEIHTAVSLGLVSVSDIISLIGAKPSAMHLVLTGRDASPELIEMADTVTEMKNVKHAYRLGIEPQKGIDY